MLIGLVLLRVAVGVIVVSFHAFCPCRSSLVHGVTIGKNGAKFDEKKNSVTVTHAVTMKAIASDHPSARSSMQNRVMPLSAYIITSPVVSAVHTNDA